MGIKLPARRPDASHVGQGYALFSDAGEVLIHHMMPPWQLEFDIPALEVLLEIIHKVKNAGYLDYFDTQRKQNVAGILMFSHLSRMY